jgi:SPP1 family phage portal protein
MTGEQIKQIIEKRRCFSRRVYDQKSYRIGVNSAIYDEPAKEEPDNRIPVPFIRRAMKLIKGYFAKVGNIKYSDEQKTEPSKGLKKVVDAIKNMVKPESWFNKYIKPIYDRNGEQLCTAELFEDAATYGSGFELHWYGKDKQFHFATLPIDQCIPIYSDDLKPVLEAFVWYRKLKDDTECATWYDATDYQEFRKGKNDEWTLNEENSGRHLYRRVPVIEANVDRDKKNLFDHMLPLIDDFDKRVSGVANEHDKFANSILLLAQKIDAVTKDDNGKTDVDNLRDSRVMDDLFGVVDDVRKAAAYLERNVNYQFIDNTLQRNERLIYEGLCLANPNDDNFATASGIAQLYKLWGMELMTADIEAYFVRALYSRIELIAGHKTSEIPDKEKAQLVTVTFVRNLPFDLQTFAMIASTATGGKQVLSRRTLLKACPLVEDVDAEIEQIEAESKSAVNPITGGEVFPEGQEDATVESVKLSGIQITAANEIIKNVSDGVLTREAGINQLTIFLGMSNAQAEQVMGSQNTGKDGDK